MINWKTPAAVRRYKRLKARIRRAKCRAAKRCPQCEVPTENRSLCNDCKSDRRERYQRLVKPQLAIGATPCRDCGRLPKRATSIRCARCQCRRASQMRWTKGQAA